MKIKRVIDLSQPMSNSGFGNPSFPETRIEPCLSYEKDGWMAETVFAATHMGTHVDAPAHKVSDGATIGDIPLEQFQGEALAVDLFHKQPGQEITMADIDPYRNRIKTGDIVLLCTGWGYYRNITDSRKYVFESPWLGGDAARFFAERKIKAVGIDHFSIGGANPEHVCIPHDLLLEAGVLIFEDMFLPRCLLERERWYVVAFPLFLGQVSGSFARMAALEFE